MNIPKVGQKVLVGSSYQSDSELVECEVCSVGRKYFKVRFIYPHRTRDIEFQITDWEKSDRERGYFECYPSIEARDAHYAAKKAEQDRGNLWRELGYQSSMSKLSLDQLRRIKAIIEEPS